MRIGDDLKSAKWMYCKGLLFVLIGLLSGGLILFKSAKIETLFLLAICVWASCRAYYFAFYVIQNYIDPSYRFSSLYQFFCYLARRRGWLPEDTRDATKKPPVN